jgi:hypothetical protein
MPRLTRQTAGTSGPVTYPSPALGWNTRDPIAAMKPGFARIMDGVVVEGGDVRMRRGWRAWATGLPGRVDGLLPWLGAGSTEALFASSGTGIYNVSTAGAVGSAVVTGLTSARWDGINFAASGGNFLFCWNGTDTERTYNGTTWATWTATGLTGRVTWGGAFKGRMFVGTANRLSFYYGGAGAIAGAFTEFPLQGIAERGGYVVGFATLTLDAGNGPDDLAIFITSEGEAIVYAGTDPASATTWGLVGRWRLPRPVGAPHRCLGQYGGDILYMCDQGVVPLRRFFSPRQAFDIIREYAITATIEPTWQALTNTQRSASGWGMCSLSRLGLLVFNVPWSATASQQVVVSENNALSRWAVPAAVWCEGMGGRAFFGDSSATGRVCLYGEDVTDAGSGLRGEVMTHYDAMRSPAKWKQALQVQPILRDALGATIEVVALTDWVAPTPQMDALGPTAAAPSVPTLPGGSSFLVWGSGLWGVGLWGGGDSGLVLPWRGAQGIGQAFALRLRLVSGNGRPAWLGSNLVVASGGPTR